MDRGAWQAAVHGVVKSLTWLKQLSMLLVSAMESNRPFSMKGKQRFLIPNKSPPLFSLLALRF